MFAMKVSDYIVEYLISKGIADVFGYPGGMVTYLMDSFSKYKGTINAHITYHEQGAAFAACGYAQASGKMGVAYATSGPGATNLITGICNAYFDSIPVLFITGQVNTFESKGNLQVRQRGFQETDIVSMVKSVTKYAVKIEDENKIKWCLDYAFDMAFDGRKGPVLLDIPMNVFRANVNPDAIEGYEKKFAKRYDNKYPELLEAIDRSTRPVFIVGNGVKTSEAISEARKLFSRINIPVVTTMPAVDVAGNKSYGFIGAYGSRTANFIVAKSDLVITMGARLDVRQVGAKRENFAPKAKLIRIDIDPGELEYRVHHNEEQICDNVEAVINYLNKNIPQKDFSPWIEICNCIKEKLKDIDVKNPNRIVHKIGKYLSNNAVVTTDVGQNQVWVAQSMEFKMEQRAFFSGGHGAMGYSLPAAIGCAFATGNTVYSFNGDGGFQMNIQELQTIVREKLPIKIILFNNFALGMIRHFQEMYFQDNFFQTISTGGYTVPDFQAIADAYKIPYTSIQTLEDITENIFSIDGPQLIEVKMNEPTYVVPKLEFGKPNQDQEPLLDRELYNYLNDL